MEMKKKKEGKKGTLVEANVCILLPSTPISDYSKRMLLTRRADIQLMDDLLAYRRAFRSTEEGDHVVPMYHAKKVGEKKATMERAS